MSLTLYVGEPLLGQTGGVLRVATLADLVEILPTIGAVEAHAVPVLPGGPPMWVNAGGPGTYLVLKVDPESVDAVDPKPSEPV